MTARAPAPVGEPAPPRATGLQVLRALKAGIIAWVPLALAGQAIAWFAFAVTGAFRPWSWVKIGLLHTIGVARVGIDVHAAPPSSLRALFPDVFGPPSVRLYVAVGAGTLAAIVLLFRAGRDAGRDVGRDASGRPARAALLGACVAPTFAAASGLSSLLVSLRFPQAEVTSLRPVVWQAFVFPLVLAAACGAVGGLAAARSAVERSGAGRRTSAIVRGGWHGFVWAIALAFLGFLLLATVRPAATAAYGRWLDGLGGTGGVIALEHALLLPDQSAGVLAVSTGSCVSLEAGGEASRLCLDGLDAGEGVTLLLTGGRAELPFGPGYLVFLLVPALGAVAGGRRAAEGARSRGERLRRASWSGGVFGALVGLAAWAGSVVVVADGRTVARLGADPLEVAGLAVVWGVLGGLVGSFVPDRRGVPREPRVGQPAEVSSETSAK